MKVELISIGTELLHSRILDTNGAHAARCLRELRFGLNYRVTVGDVSEHIVTALRDALRRSEVIITIGGLGSGPDDVTRDALTQVFEEQLVGAQPLGNATDGTGLMLPLDGQTLFCLPGRPRGMSHLLETAVFPFLKTRWRSGLVADWRLLRTAGLMESSLRHLLAGLEMAPGQRLTFTSHAGQSDIRLWVEGASEAEVAQSLASLTQRVRELLAEHIYGEAGDHLEQVVVRQLRASYMKLVVVEYNTDRTLSGLLEQVPGATAVVQTPDIDAEHLTRQLDLPSLNGDLMQWCRLAAERLRRDMSADLALVLYKTVEPGGVQLLLTLASSYGVTTTQRAFGGHPDSIEEWASTLAMVQLRGWLVANVPG